MCKKLEVSRSGFYAWAKRAPSEHCRRDQALLRLIAGHFEESNGIESFFHSLKTEAIHGRRFSDAMQLDTAVRRYIERYNRTRIHSSLAYMSPIDYERTNA